MAVIRSWSYVSSDSTSYAGRFSYSTSFSHPLLFKYPSQFGTNRLVYTACSTGLTFSSNSKNLSIALCS